MSIRNYFRKNPLGRKIAIAVLTFPRLVNNPIYYSVYQQFIRWKARRMIKQAPVVHIETTNVCNARCTMCSYPIMQRPKGYMSDQLYLKILRDCAEMRVADVNLQYLGEPLLDQKICDRIREAKEYGFRVQMVSNASLLDEAKARGLLASGVDELRISMDGFTPKTFEDIRVGLKFEKVKGNVERFLDLRARHRGARPRVVMCFV